MANLKKLKFKSDTILIRENEISRKLYILKKGKVRVFKNYLGGKIVLAILGPGEIFGELSFFDSKPRSASVEAISDVEVESIDGEALNDDIKALPPWVHLIFRSVAMRFREIDQKMAVLQSLNNFQRKNLSRDSVGNTIYSDLIRLTKILKMILNEKGNNLEKNFYIEELSHTIGDPFISPRAYLRVLFEYNFVENMSSLLYNFNTQKLTELENYLKARYEQDSCTILSYQTVAIMRKIASFMELSQEQNEVMVKVPEAALEIQAEDREIEDAISEMKKKNIIFSKSDGLYIQPKDFLDNFEYHSIIKAFDHTIIYE